ncbi:MAG: hypothetical protein GKS07_04915 [Nitrosopumilus sp.]|nr:MAG: hypothetical protein GKS07_04915 [Nitrosopumilus sp.]
MVFHCKVWFYDCFLKEKRECNSLRLQHLFLFVIALGMFAGIAYFENSFAQKETSPHQQWEKFADIDMITCKPGYLLILKTGGNPLCVTPATYLKLVDRGYGNYDPSIMSQRPAMSNDLMHAMISNESLMQHWHEMMQKNTTVKMKTAANWISHVRDDPDLLKNILDPIASDPKLRLAMIDVMENHTHMETSLKQHSGWMDSVHHPMINPEKANVTGNSACTWCTEYQMHGNDEYLNEFTSHDRMMAMIHAMWLNLKTSQDLHRMMLENPVHMGQMSKQMMDPVLNMVMDDERLRQQMIDLLLEHQDFMNTVRHGNPETNH